MISPSFNQEKATQAVAYLLNKTANKREYHLLVVKMLYIAERRALQRWGRLITWDRFVSMDHGPVPNQTYALISGGCPNSAYWDQFISDKADHMIELLETPDMRKLSRAEQELLDEVYGEFGSCNRFAVSEQTHTFAEWVDPCGSSLPIELEDILRAGDASEDLIGLIRTELDGLAAAEAIFA